MNAIEAVVRKCGLAGLSIDAVAREAGISKSSVVYDFENKNQLLAAFIKSRIDEKRSQVADCAATKRGEQNAWLRALLENSASVPSDEDMATAMLVSAGMSSGDTCRTLMQDVFAQDMAHILTETDNPRMARLAWLALNGLLSMECFGFYKFPPEEREELLADIAWLMATDPPSALPT